MHDAIREAHTFCLSVFNPAQKSWITLELIADNKEFAVAVIAATIAHAAKTNTTLLETLDNTGINGFAPMGTDIFFIFAKMPKKSGMQEKAIKIIPAKNADIVAVNRVFAAKNR